MISLKEITTKIAVIRKTLKDLVAVMRELEKQTKKKDKEVPE